MGYSYNMVNVLRCMTFRTEDTQLRMWVILKMKVSSLQHRPGQV